MALKVWDGWDHYKALADMEQRSGFLQYVTYTNIPVFSFVTGRNGNGKALRAVINQTGLQFVYQDRNQQALVGQAVFHEVAGNSAAGVVYSFIDTVTLQPFSTVPTVQCSVHFNKLNYSIEVWLGQVTAFPFGNQTGTLLYASPNNQWAANVWNYVEIDVKIHDTTGSVKVNVNGITKVNLTNVDTKTTSNTWWDAMYIEGTGVAGINSFVIDDHYYADKVVGPGTFPADTFLGDAKVVTLFATGNDSVQWTPLAGQNWQEISEIAMDSDVTYNFDATPGHQDTFVFQPLAGTITTIYGIQVTYATRKDDAGMKTIKSVVKSGGTDYFGATNSIPDTNYVYFTDLWILDPDTGANWVLTGVNSATYGYNLVS